MWWCVVGGFLDLVFVLLLLPYNYDGERVASAGLCVSAIYAIATRYSRGALSNTFSVYRGCREIFNHRKCRDRLRGLGRGNRLSLSSSLLRMVGLTTFCYRDASNGCSVALTPMVSL